MNQIDINSILPLVEKPSRYIDNEINAVHKDPNNVDVRICLAFPDLYELGVSHLGLKILYSIINRLDWAMADRVYLPWLDMIELMREEELPLWGLESRLLVRDFDLLGLTLQSELTFTNILEMLDIAGIPVLAAQRGTDCPIVMAGGPCATNPLPLSSFIDVFFIGEAEEAIVEIAEILRACPDKESRLLRLSGLESCYVPSIHGLNPSKTIKARKYSLFHEGNALHSPQIMSWQLATHNRYVAEIMRGCSRGCRFCHAGYFYRPVRERNADDILEELLRETRQTGWDEAGLISLSSSDYSCIKPLLLNLLNTLDTDQTHVSLPSLRVDSLDDELVTSLKDLGREGLTIAPEAGSQRLRDVINKNLTEESILKGIETAISLGWQKIKLYFMIGLPTETEEDIDGIIDLIGKINRLGRGRLQINVTLSPFVPKPFTPFQWEAFAPLEQSLSRILRVKHHYNKQRNIKIRYHNLESSKLEAIISRGDAKISELIHKAWRNGAIYDGWNESFSYSRWEDAAREMDLDLAVVLDRIETEDHLAWDFVDTGVCKSFLLIELQRALAEETTEDCRELCSMCGACDDKTATVSASPIDLKPARQKIEPIDTARRLQDQHHYRVFYRKTGILRFIAHLDWMRMLYRWISSLKLETVFTQGFNPHPKVSLSPPLPLGINGEEEYFDVSYFEPYAVQIIADKFAEIKIPDFQIIRVEKTGTKAMLPVAEELRVLINPLFADQVASSIALFRSRDSHPYTKKTEKREKTYDLSLIITEISLEGNEILITKDLQSPSLFGILESILGLSRKILYSFEISRIRFIYS